MQSVRIRAPKVGTKENLTYEDLDDSTFAQDFVIILPMLQHSFEHSSFIFARGISMLYSSRYGDSLWNKYLRVPRFTEKAGTKDFEGYLIQLPCLEKSKPKSVCLLSEKNLFLLPQMVCEEILSQILHSGWNYLKDSLSIRYLKQDTSEEYNRQLQPRVWHSQEEVILQRALRIRVRRGSSFILVAMKQSGDQSILREESPRMSSRLRVFVNLYFIFPQTNPRTTRTGTWNTYE